MDNYYDVMKYFKAKYPKIILDVNLEDLTDDSERVTKKIFDFCRLTWDSKILNFYRRKDLYSKTLSLTQIRSEVTKYDSEKYKAYYYILNEYKDKYKWLNI